jgi:hypothetical protein
VCCHPVYDPDDPYAVECYRDALLALRRGGVPVLVGGAYAFARHTGIARHTKDFDLFLREADVQRALVALEAAGYRTEVAYAHWLAKAFRGEYFIDLIHSSGNGVAPVDDDWFAHASKAVAFGVPVRICPAEEMVWQKAFIMERDRFDGADINHLLRACGHRLDWKRLLTRFGHNWPVLYAHLVLFTFAYPAEAGRVPAWVMRDLAGRLAKGQPSPGRVCRGPLLAALQYLPDLERWHYEDARLAPSGSMTREQVAVWTEGLMQGK